MTNPTQNTRPVVKSMKPELYVQHTFHMKKARSYTYNYAVMDDYILQNWHKSSIKDMAKELNEYSQRVEYRIQVLKAAGFLGMKRNMERGKLMRQRKHLVTWLKEVDAKLEGVA